MFKKTICLFSFVFLMGCSNDDGSNGISKITKEVNVYTYGGSQNDLARSVVPTADGGYILLGHAQSSDGDITDKANDSFDYWAARFGADNSLQWSKTYGGSNDDRGMDIIPAHDGGFAILGHSDSVDGDVSENSGGKDFWLVKIDGNGDMQWEKSFGFSGKDEGVSLIATSDNGFLLIGILDVVAANGQGNAKSRHAGGDYWAVKVDALGNFQWSRFFGGTFTDTPYGAVESSNGDFIIAGSSDSDDFDISNNKGDYDFWTIKISALGDLIWEKNYGGKEIDEAHAILAMDNGNYLIVGETRSTDIDVASNNGAADVWVASISDEGDLLWEKTYGGTNFDVGRSAIKTADGGFAITGSSRSENGDVSENKGQNDIWVLTISDEGVLEWETAIGGAQVDFAYGITELTDGRLIVVGESSSSTMDVPENKGFTDALVIEVLK